MHGTTLLLTTHDKDDVQRLCDRILVVDRGRLAYDGTLPGLVRRVGAERVLTLDLNEPSDPLTGIPSTRLVEIEPDGLRQRHAFRRRRRRRPQFWHRWFSGRTSATTIDEPDIEDVVRRLYLSSSR